MYRKNYDGDNEVKFIAHLVRNLRNETVFRLFVKVDEKVDGANMKRTLQIADLRIDEYTADLISSELYIFAYSAGVFLLDTRIVYAMPEWAMQSLIKRLLDYPCW